MIKGAPLHALLDFHFSFHEDQSQQTPIEVDLEELPSSIKSSSSQFQLSKFVHALNAVTEVEDVGNLQKARYFLLLLDETNDISCAKNLMIYWILIEKNSIKIYEIVSFTRMRC